MRQVTFEPGRIEAFDVAASGDLAYSLFDSVENTKVLKLIPADGGPARVIDSVAPDSYACGDIASPLFSPDGQTLVYSREEIDPATNRCFHQLLFFDMVANKEQVVLDSRDEFDASITTPRTQKRLASMSYAKIWSPHEWSADSRFLTVSDTEIWYVVDRMTFEVRTASVSGWEAELSPDGAQLYVGGVIHDPFETGACSSYEGLTGIDFEVRTAKRMLWCNYDVYALRLDPSKSVLYFVRTQQPNALTGDFSDLMSISTDPPFGEPKSIRSTTFRLTHVNNTDPALWAPDGGRVVFHTYSQGGELGSLVVLPIQTQDRIEVLAMPLVVSDRLHWGPVPPTDLALATQVATQSSAPPAVPPTPSPEAHSTAGPATGLPECLGAPPSRLQLGQPARITISNGLPVRMRSRPGKAGEVIAQVPEGTSVTLMENPICEEGLLWWKVEIPTGEVGYVAEGTADGYLLEPAP
jgi:hypothetical protein